MPAAPVSSRPRSPTSTIASTSKKSWPRCRDLDSPPGRGSTLGALTASTTHLLSIGRFARTTGLSIRTLRRYDAIGLLVPAHVDEARGRGAADVGANAT